jgi:hypothetical protein
MRLLFPLLILIFICIIANGFMKITVGADPKDEARQFISDVREGGLAKTVKHFGGNTCRCPFKGGWGSYLIYVSAQEPNLAFMTGHPFEFGAPSMVRLKNDREALLPWQKPEDTAVDVPITFNPKVYAPLFLPLPMAYGETMTEDQLNQWLKDPDKDAWKGFTLRFRPSLKQGAIAPPNEPLPPQAATEFQALNSKAQDAHKSETQKKLQQEETSTEDAVRKALGNKATEYLKPKDAGPVVDQSGKPIATDKIESELPRLKTAILRLHVVRRGSINDWTIYHFGLVNPVLLMADGTDFKLVHDRRPDYLPKDPTQVQPKEEPAATAH